MIAGGGHLGGSDPGKRLGLPESAGSQGPGGQGTAGLELPHLTFEVHQRYSCRPLSSHCPGHHVSCGDREGEWWLLFRTPGRLLGRGRREQRPHWTEQPPPPLGFIAGIWLGELGDPAGARWPSRPCFSVPAPASRRGRIWWRDRSSVSSTGPQQEHALSRLAAWWCPGRRWPLWYFVQVPVLSLSLAVGSLVVTLRPRPGERGGKLVNLPSLFVLRLFGLWYSVPCCL